MGNLAKNICNFIKAIIFDCYKKFSLKEIFFSKNVSEEAPKVTKTFFNKSLFITFDSFNNFIILIVLG